MEIGSILVVSACYLARPHSMLSCLERRLLKEQVDRRQCAISEPSIPNFFDNELHVTVHGQVLAVTGDPLFQTGDGFGEFITDQMAKSIDEQPKKMTGPQGMERAPRLLGRVGVS